VAKSHAQAELDEQKRLLRNSENGVFVDLCFIPPAAFPVAYSIPRQ
jgi:hypothetical protein